jgi:diguanylate cyclase (GGDEF)-like protein
VEEAQVMDTTWNSGWLETMQSAPLAAEQLRRLRAAVELQVKTSRREVEELLAEADRRLRLASRERRRTEERLVQAALHDPLTGLPNRILFRRRLERALTAGGPEKGGRVAVLFLDLDRFTLLNNSLGHHAGDELLRDVAACLSRCVGPDDTVARLGGDEFALLRERIDEVAEAAALAERVRGTLARPFAIEGRQVFTGASIGVAVGGGAGESPERLLRDADIALHRAKERGRSRHEIFHPTLHARMMDRLEVETDLRGALDRGELRLAYQPILSRRHNAVAGFEALVRWQHPRRGLVMPGDFIPAAEETGLIVPIDEWVLAEVAAQLERWRDGPLGALAVSVNLSRRQLRVPDFLGHVEELVRAGRLDGSRLHLEITESALAEDAVAAARVLAGIKRLGIQLVVDDFGTGYSSLASLVGLPVDRLKIDRSFVHGLDTTPEHRDMVRAITRLAHDLSLEVIAEGVETAAQLAELARLEVDDVQGFLIAPPLGCAEAEAFVLAGGAPTSPTGPLES